MVKKEKVSSIEVRMEDGVMVGGMKNGMDHHRRWIRLENGQICSITLTSKCPQSMSTTYNIQYEFRRKDNNNALQVFIQKQTINVVGHIYQHRISVESFWWTSKYDVQIEYDINGKNGSPINSRANYSIDFAQYNCKMWNDIIIIHNIWIFNWSWILFETISTSISIGNIAK